MLGVVFLGLTGLRTRRIRVDRIGAGFAVRVRAVIFARAAALITRTVVARRNRALLAIVSILAIRGGRSVFRLAAIAYFLLFAVLFLAVLCWLAIGRVVRLLLFVVGQVLVFAVTFIVFRFIVVQ